MESFSLLKYWRTPSAPPATNPDSPASAKPSTKTIVAASVSPYSSDGEDGPYFDLEFALPDPDGNAPQSEDEDDYETGSDDDDEEGEEGEIDFALAAGDCADQNATLSPSDELFFKGDLVSIQPSNILLNASEENSKFPVFLVKSATKFRVLLLKLKKSRSSNWESGGRDETENNQGKSFAVKFNVEELPLVNLFTRDASSKDNNGGKPAAAAKNNVEDSEERKVTKEVMQKYLKMVKPFYIRVSKRYVEKMKFSGHLSFPGGGSKSCAAAPPPPEKGGEAAASNVRTQQKQGTTNLQAGLRVVRKHLGKSRSASAAVSAASPGKTTSERRDDSLLQVQDGIQGAILHCKRSFNASRDVESSSVLCRSVSDPSYEKSVMKGEAKGCKN